MSRLQPREEARNAFPAARHFKMDAIIMIRHDDSGKSHLGSRGMLTRIYDQSSGRLACLGKWIGLDWISVLSLRVWVCQVLSQEQAMARLISNFMIATASLPFRYTDIFRNI